MQAEKSQIQKLNETLIKEEKEMLEMKKSLNSQLNEQKEKAASEQKRLLLEIEKA